MLRLRFIPAYAGNARPTITGTRSGAVHPRIRGERLLARPGVTVESGSSPHTRGTQPFDPELEPGERFIPAYAGNACPGRRRRAGPSVHPRIRGERLVRWKTSARTRGSSPHTRGTRPNLSASELGNRFIPAYAGNAMVTTVSAGLNAVHPRIRGERNIAKQIDTDPGGSSPHTRGTRSRRAAPLWRNRFIPAYAGNAARSRRPSTCPPVHPRIRGERSIRIFARAVTNGSSPHTRGTLARGVARNCDQRFIPAYAGNAAA